MLPSWSFQFERVIFRLMKRTLITSDQTVLLNQLRELYRYRDLVQLLALRDIKVKYAQAVIGLLWTLLLPIINVVILILVFDKVAEIKTASVPYPLFAIAGVAAWTYFSETLVGSSQSLIGNQNLVKKVYFPRLAIPLSKMLPPFIDFGIAALFFIGLCFYYKPTLQVNFLLLLLHFFMLVLMSLTGGIWISAISIRFRDFTYVLPLIMRLFFFLSPIGYPLSEVPEEYQWFYQLNPIACSIAGIREALFGIPEGLSLLFVFVYLGLIALFLLGLIYFNKVEQTIADYL
jgi:lipopolysaccharide transport system permease protein